MVLFVTSFYLTTDDDLSMPEVRRGSGKHEMSVSISTYCCSFPLSFVSVVVRDDLDHRRLGRGPLWDLGEDFGSRLAASVECQPHKKVLACTLERSMRMLPDTTAVGIGGTSQLTRTR